MNKVNPILILLIALSVASWIAFHEVASPDLLATWMAGKHFAAGSFDQIYPTDVEIFKMYPPSEWVPFLRGIGYEDAVFPFIYPPIWAWVGSGIYRVATFEAFSSVASLINPLLLGATVWLAAKMVCESISSKLYMVLIAVFFATSIPALVALEQNQPQILVGFLLVLGVERTRFGSPIFGGVAMALAASLKLYPAIFAILWLAQGEKRAVASFTVVGGMLGLISILVAGWPLHAAFLSEIAVISKSVLITSFTYSIDPTIAKFLFSDQLLAIPTTSDLSASGGPTGWLVMGKTTLWRVADVALLLATVGFLIVTARSARGNDPLFWPLAITCIALVSPLSWGYHYLAALAFAGALLERFGTRIGLIGLFAVFYPASTLFLYIGFPGVNWGASVQPLATLAMGFYAAFLWLAMRKRPKA